MGIGDSLCAHVSVSYLYNKIINDIYVLCSNTLLKLFNNINNIKKAFTYDNYEQIKNLYFEWIIDLYSINKTQNIINKLIYKNCIYRNPEDVLEIIVQKDTTIKKFESPVFNYKNDKCNYNDPIWLLEATLIAHVIKENYLNWKKYYFIPILKFKNKNNSARKNIIKNNIFIFPCGSANIKRWPEENWIQLCNNLIKITSYNIHIIIGPKENGVYKKLTNISKIKVHLSMDLFEIAKKFYSCKLVIANDCGPMHLAANFGLPLIGIFGPTNPHCWFLYNRINQVYMQSSESKIRMNPNGIIKDVNKTWKYWISPKKVYLKALELLK